MFFRCAIYPVDGLVMQVDVICSSLWKNVSDSVSWFYLFLETNKDSNQGCF
jgi:hypothetical protein